MDQTKVRRRGFEVDFESSGQVGCAGKIFEGLVEKIEGFEEETEDRVSKFVFAGRIEVLVENSGVGAADAVGGVGVGVGSGTEIAACSKFLSK